MFWRPDDGSPTMSSPPPHGESDDSSGSRLGLYGIQRIHLLPDALILAGAGVGGGSLVYANTLYVPPREFFDDPQWSGIADWSAELAPYYDQAKRMLGVNVVPHRSPLDETFAKVADEMGVGETFRLTPVGVFFGAAPGRTVPDPFFGGAGSARTGCIVCGECMTGCRHNAKNTLPRNHLGLAESAGAVVQPMTTVSVIRPGPAGGYAVDTVHTGPLMRSHRTFTAHQVVVAAGAFNTQKLLHRMRSEGYLPAISARLGHKSRTNSELLVGAVSRRRDVDFTRGVAITSSFHPDPYTHVEPVRYGRGSNLMAARRRSPMGAGHAAMEGVVAGSGGAAHGRFAVAERAPLVRTRCYCTGHAIVGQLADGERAADQSRPVEAHLQTGRWRTRSDLDPGR